MQLNREQLLRAYREMRLIREFEERVHSEFANGLIPGFVLVPGLVLGPRAPGDDQHCEHDADDCQPLIHRRRHLRSLSADRCSARCPGYNGRRSLQ